MSFSNDGQYLVMYIYTTFSLPIDGLLISNLAYHDQCCSEHVSEDIFSHINHINFYLFGSYAEEILLDICDNIDKPRRYCVNYKRP
jgi:hypothetical protein